VNATQLLHLLGILLFATGQVDYHQLILVHLGHVTRRSLQHVIAKVVIGPIVVAEEPMETLNGMDQFGGSRRTSLGK